VLNDFGSRRFAVTDDRGSTPKTVQHTLDEKARKLGFPIVWSEQRSKSVNVMARDHHSPCWQRISEMGIAVIDDVKHIGGGPLPWLLAEPTRIAPEPMRDPFYRRHLVSVPSCPHRQLRRERRPNENGMDPSLLVRGVLHQHVRHQVHARPPLFEKIGDDRDLQRVHGH
jgi:hypothetical protein